MSGTHVLKKIKILYSSLEYRRDFLMTKSSEILLIMELDVTKPQAPAQKRQCARKIFAIGGGGSAPAYIGTIRRVLLYTYNV